MIKFRVWDKEEKKMHKVKTIEFSRRGARIIHLAEVNSNGKGNHKKWHSSVELMQSTGTRYIYDEKGKEIFEGDIVKTRASEYGRFIGYVDNAISRFKVRGVKQYKGLSVDLDGTCEIIGNIYENPELVDA
ncbi:YopX family protein [Staphylococcus haemolyticus]|uniref:YopX family protein n=1 Tax=Staphylococcus haemolyticus TaxID=1283 RepID=UPI002DBFCDC4|nr:YopX family protein [Staphylococcus haemolyticus]MEB5827144.1 YopX family protein [Staphylococcus haemolyticus]